jgi:hypothetical protein
MQRKQTGDQSRLRLKAILAELAYVGIQESILVIVKNTKAKVFRRDG